MMGAKGGGKEAKLARQDEQQRQQRVRDGTEKINGIFDTQFNEPFFADRQKAFNDYALPQLQDQYGDAQKELTFALARGGNLNSSARATQAGDLQKRFDLNSQQIGDQALSSATDARNATEDARANLIATLNATGDAQQAANSAVSRASALSTPAAFSPLSNLFADLTSAYGTKVQVDNYKKYAGGAGLFSPSSSAVVVKH